MERSSVYTQEGNRAGPLAAKLAEARNRKIEEFQREREKLSEIAHGKQLKSVEERFRTEVLEDTTEGIYGLKSREEFAELQKTAEKRRALANLDADSKALRDAELARKKKRKLEKRRSKAAQKSKTLLSFGDALGKGEEEEEEVAIKAVKNPGVDTDFLPDKERDEARLREKVALRRKWVVEQEHMKREPLDVVFSYWDGRGHRSSVRVTKGATIEHFLSLARAALAKEFRELRNTAVENLMYIKEDMIIPPYLTFYDLITSRARGRTGPLFRFDVRDDVRVVNDIRQHTEHSHAGKVCQRSWYEKQKHLYPASKWEVYDPKSHLDASE